jgi:hypothetical protein
MLRRLTAAEMADRRGCISTAMKNSREAIVVNAFSTLKQLMISRKKNAGGE